MPRGGHRPGAGRKRGSKNRAVIEREKAAKAAAAAGLDPLQYILDAMRDPRTSSKRRDWAAATALPYCRPRLQAIQGDPEKPIIHEHRMGSLDAARRIAFVLFTASNPEIGRTIEHEPQKKVAA